jgi:hypothetical protein
MRTLRYCFTNELGLTRSHEDYDLYCNTNVIHLLLYMDDILLFGPDLGLIKGTKEQLSEMSDVRY